MDGSGDFGDNDSQMGVWSPSNSWIVLPNEADMDGNERMADRERSCDMEDEPLMHVPYGLTALTALELEASGTPSGQASGLELDLETIRRTNATIRAVSASNSALLNEENENGDSGASLYHSGRGILASPSSLGSSSLGSINSITSDASGAVPIVPDPASPSPNSMACDAADAHLRNSANALPTDRNAYSTGPYGCFHSKERDVDLGSPFARLNPLFQHDDDDDGGGAAVPLGQEREPYVDKDAKEQRREGKTPLKASGQSKTQTYDFIGRIFAWGGYKEVVPFVVSHMLTLIIGFYAGKSFAREAVA